MWTPARKVLIEDLQQGEYREATEEEPAHIVTLWGEKASRVRVLGTVVDKTLEEERYCFLYLDDGTGVISLRAWGEDMKKLEKYEIGSLLDVIGKVKEFSGEIYLQPELVMRVEDPNLETLRLLELVRARKKLLNTGLLPRPKKEVPPVEVLEVGVESRVEETIVRLDRGSGVSAEEIARELKLSRPEVEEGIRRLLALGSIYEVQPGRFRRI
ncbi:MAG: OB-fold nucleic acid binding domain-containing protein [Candidatus Hadarchaeales archaeon]